MTYTEPPTEDLARLSAEAMGWESQQEGLYDRPEGGFPWACGIKPPLGCQVFQPHKSHDHAQILLDEAFRRGRDFENAFFMYIVELNKENISPWKFLLSASPEQKTRAFLRTIYEAKQ